MPPVIVLPKVKQDDLKIWDIDREECGGYLHKKASQNSIFGKGRWQKRYFCLRTDLEEESDNYVLEYYHHPDDKFPRMRYPLAYASLLQSGGNNFTISTMDNSIVALKADDFLGDWVFTLERAIAVATVRDRLIRERGIQPSTTSSQYDNNKSQSGGDRSYMDTADDTTKKSILSSSYEYTDDNQRQEQQQQPQDRDAENESISRKPFLIQHKKSPAVRLDVDINTIPPTTASRRKFEESFISDVARALRIDPHMIEIFSVKPATGMQWLTCVEFDIYVFPQPRDEDEIYDEEHEEELEMERSAIRLNLLQKLVAMIKDLSSPLYNGYVTCKLDPTFTANLDSDITGYEELEVFSTESHIVDIMNKYKDIKRSDDMIDLSYFTIYLHYEDPFSGITMLRSIQVPNPFVLRRRCCFVYPFEIKDVLGLAGTLSEIWMHPIALTPKDMPKSLSQPVLFEPSARLGGLIAINASRLKAGLTYEVIMQDLRESCLTEGELALTDEEMVTIEEDFIQFDVNHDNGISRSEMEELVRVRTQDKKEIIEEKYQEFLMESGITQELIHRGEEKKKLFLQHLSEAQSKLLKMFDAADADGNGKLSFLEFQLAEWWWLKCTLNPEKAHLF